MDNEVPNHKLVLGADLKVGDTIIPWHSKTAVIELLRNDATGLRVAFFAPHSESRIRTMSIWDDERYRLVIPSASPGDGQPE